MNEQNSNLLAYRAKLLYELNEQEYNQLKTIIGQVIRHINHYRNEPDNQTRGMRTWIGQYTYYMEENNILGYRERLYKAILFIFNYFLDELLY